MTQPIQKKWWRKGSPKENPFNDPLRQELGYKLDERYSGCFMIALAAGLLAVAIGGFLLYWLTRS